MTARMEEGGHQERGGDSDTEAGGPWGKENENGEKEKDKGGGQGPK